jgi:two-component system, NarL family, invasion response regulator UvrY
MTEHARAPLNRKVLVIANNAVLRSGLVQYLRLMNSSFTVGEASLESDLAQVDPAGAWDMIALDLQGGIDLEIVRRLKQLHPNIPVLVLNDDSKHVHVMAAIAAGASGYLSKSSAVQDWRSAFETVAAGGNYPTPIPPPDTDRRRGSQSRPR